MKTTTPQTILNLAAYRNFWRANLFHIVCLDGTIFDFTDFENDIHYAAFSTVFSSRGPRITFSGFSQKIGVEVDEAKLKIYATPANVVVSQAFLEYVGQGGLEGAVVIVFRAMLPNPNDGSVPRPIQFPLTTYGDAPIVFTGFVGDISNLDRTGVEVTVKSRKELLNIPFPYKTYQASCPWPLYGAGCNILQSSFTTSDAIAGIAGVPLLFQTGLTQADNYFDEGVIQFTSGLNVGAIRTVRTYLNASGQILLFYPLPTPPVAGDTFDIAPGCDKQSQTCTIKFSNLLNWGGTEFVPVPEAAV